MNNTAFTHIVLNQYPKQFVSIDFIKKDGTPRTLSGVVVEQPENMKHMSDKYILIKCMGKDLGKYRQVSAATVREIRAGGRVFNP